MTLCCNRNRLFKHDKQTTHINAVECARICQQRFIAVQHDTLTRKIDNRIHTVTIECVAVSLIRTPCELDHILDLTTAKSCGRPPRVICGICLCCQSCNIRIQRQPTIHVIIAVILILPPAVHKAITRHDVERSTISRSNNICSFLTGLIIHIGQRRRHKGHTIQTHCRNILYTILGHTQTPRASDKQVYFDQFGIQKQRIARFQNSVRHCGTVKTTRILVAVGTIQRRERIGSRRSPCRTRSDIRGVIHPPDIARCF